MGDYLGNNRALVTPEDLIGAFFLVFGKKMPDFYIEKMGDPGECRDGRGDVIVFYLGNERGRKACFTRNLLELQLFCRAELLYFGSDVVFGHTYPTHSDSVEIK
jgi:hypothetical protein